jgi:hypothetical protein
MLDPIMGDRAILLHQPVRTLAMSREFAVLLAFAAISFSKSERDYIPPKRERILEWMEQWLPHCPDPNDPSQCSVYQNLNFPNDVYNKIQNFYRRAGVSGIRQSGDRIELTNHAI